MMDKTSLIITGALLGFIATEGDRIILDDVGFPLLSYILVFGIIFFAIIEYLEDKIESELKFKDLKGGIKKNE